MVFSSFFGGLLTQAVEETLDLAGKSLNQENLIDVSSVVFRPQGVIAKPDGKMLISTAQSTTGSSVNRVLSSFSGSTAWDASSMTHASTSSQLDKLTGDNDTGFTDISSQDGINWYAVMNNFTIYHYQSTSAWDVSTIGTTVVGSYDVSGQTGTEMSLCVQGTKLYYTNNGVASARRLRCLDISSGLSSATEILNVDIDPTRAQSCFVSSDGRTAFITDIGNTAIFQYSIDQSAGTATREATIDLSVFTPSITNPRGIDVKGDKVIIADYGNSNLTIFSAV